MPEDQTKSCGMAEALLVRCVDSELSEGEEIPVLRHAANCPDCAEQIQRMRVYRQSWAVLSPEFPALVQRMTALAKASRAAERSVAAAVTSMADSEWPGVQQALEFATQRTSPASSNEPRRKPAILALDAAKRVLLSLSDFSFGAVISELLAEPVPARRSVPAFRDATPKPVVTPSTEGVVAVQIRFENRTLQVKVSGFPTPAGRVMVQVIPEVGEPESTEAQIRGNDLVATFRNLDPGKCAIALKPLSNTPSE